MGLEVDLIPSLPEAPRETLDTLTVPEPVTIGGAEFPIRLVADEDIKHTDQDGHGYRLEGVSALSRSAMVVLSVAICSSKKSIFGSRIWSLQYMHVTSVANMISTGDMPNCASIAGVKILEDLQEPERVISTKSVRT
jgi:hypothetical protein